ncbi:MAG: 50S ribosomal protein L25/general stress protein Ctc [Bacillota bacterium]|nr:50S ribosomal protein L25/general stress protein Ctc [Bacillota bacterium]MDW7683047.1 50S ribosomal protein L25/general stress protein Ctc [Bacillota bacterium]
MERIQVQAAPRETASKGHLKSLRAEGMVPATVYGQKDAAKSVSVDAKDITAVVQSATGLNTLIDLAVEGNKETVIIKQLERDILLADRFTHIDFLRISLKDKLEVQVPVILTGEAAGVKEGGILQQSLREVSLKCLPTDIPEHLELDVTNLGVGESLSVAELAVPEGSEFISEPDETVVTVVAPRMAEDAAEEGEAEEAQRETEAGEENAAPEDAE